MAQFFRIGKSRTLCPATMHVKSIGGIMLDEFHCGLPRDHEGNHVSPKGLVWVNNVKYWENIEKAMDPIKRKILLP